MLGEGEIESDAMGIAFSLGENAVAVEDEGIQLCRCSVSSRNSSSSGRTLMTPLLLLLNNGNPAARDERRGGVMMGAEEVGGSTRRGGFGDASVGGMQH